MPGQRLPGTVQPAAFVLHAHLGVVRGRWKPCAAPPAKLTRKQLLARALARVQEAEEQEEALGVHKRRQEALCAQGQEGSPRRRGDASSVSRLNRMGCLRDGAIRLKIRSGRAAARWRCSPRQRSGDLVVGGAGEPALEHPLRVGAHVLQGRRQLRCICAHRPQRRRCADDSGHHGGRHRHSAAGVTATKVTARRRSGQWQTAHQDMK